MELSESRSREDNLRKMNETIMQAMNSTDLNKSHLVVILSFIHIYNNLELDS